MKTLQNYIVDGAIYRQDTQTPIVVGNLVKVYLDTEAVPSFPEFILGVIQHPIVKVKCDSATSYSIEYNEDELGGDVEFLRVSDVIDVQYASTGVGSVESVGLAAPNIFSVSGSPVTSIGTLTFALVSQTQAKFLGSPADASGVPTFRAIQGSDITNLTISHVTNLSTSLSAITSSITDIQEEINSLSNAAGINFMWKTFLSASQPEDDEAPRNYDVRGGRVNSHGSSIDVTGITFSGNLQVYVALTRNTDSRALTGATMQTGATIPASTAAVQYVPVSEVVAGEILQKRFHEINVHELMFTYNGAFSLMTVDMAAQNVYPLPA